MGTRIRIGIATALLAAATFTAQAVGGAGVQAASAITTTTPLACNNTFNGSKFPLEYRVVATPSANPIAPGSSFTVSFNVTVIASAGFLNAVYAALGQVTAIPITSDKATIVPATGATGPAVQVVLGSTFTIPKPASTPVTVGQEIPLGTVQGTYTADASGTVSFQFKGNAWSPTDTLPSGVSEAAWTGSGGGTALTSSGAATFTQASLLSGIVKPYLVCMPGSWTQGGTTDAPTFAAPLVPATSGFASIPIGDAPTTTTPGTTTPPTTAPGTTAPGTTAPGTTAPGTTAPATTTPGTTAPPTTTPPTTAPPTTTPATTIPATKVTGTATYSASCKDNLVNGTYALTFVGSASAMSPQPSGGSVTVSDQQWKITIPADLAATLSGVVGPTFDSTFVLTLNATNASPASVKSSTVTAPVSIAGAGPATITVNVPAMTFTATGAGPVVVTFGGSVTTVTIAGSPVALTCSLTGAAPALLTVQTYGPPAPTTTTIAPAPTTTIVGSGGPVPTNGGNRGGSGGSLANTGSPLAQLWFETFIGLAILQLGLWLWAVGSRRQRSRS